MPSRESYLNMLPTGIRIPLRKMFDSGCSLMLQLVLDRNGADGVVLSADYTDNGIEISGTCTEAAIDIQGTQTAAGLLISGNCASAITISGTNTADITLSNGATIHNTNATTLTLTETNIMLSGAIKLNGTVTFDDDGTIADAANVMTITQNTITIAGSSVINLNGAVLVTGGLYIAAGGEMTVRSTNKLFLGSSSNVWIRSYTSNCIEIRAESSATGSVNIIAGADTNGTVQIYGYLRLKRTDTDGDQEAEMWFDDSENRIKFYGGAAVRTVADLSHDQLFTGVMNISNELAVLSTNKFFLGSNSNVWIRSYTADALEIRSASTGVGSINIIAGTDNSGTVQLYGYLRLKRTTVDGTVDGQIWYDTASNKIQGRANGSTVDLH